MSALVAGTDAAKFWRDAGTAPVVVLVQRRAYPPLGVIDAAFQLGQRHEDAA